jgi:hypothetical protein
VSPYCCPVCQGKGLVPMGFYTAIGQEHFSASDTAPERCRSCGGGGVLWGFDPMPPAFDPPLTYSLHNTWCDPLTGSLETAAGPILVSWPTWAKDWPPKAPPEPSLQEDCGSQATTYTWLTPLRAAA